MHEPADSFKSKIASYREWLATTPPDDVHYQFVLGILDRWERHPDVEAIWDKIKPTLPPEIFILAILKTGRVAAKIDRLAHELPREAKPISRIERFLTERQLGQGNRFLAWLGDLRQGQERLLSRNTETAARTQFMVTLRDYFAVQCGQSLDDVVAPHSYFTRLADGARMRTFLLACIREPKAVSAREL